MDRRDVERIADHLGRIEQRLDNLDRRLAQLEGEQPEQLPTAAPTGAAEPPAAPTEPVAPPRIYAPAPPPPEPAPQELRQLWDLDATPSDSPPPAAMPPATPASQAASGDELEYKIGRIGLLWAGAGVVLVGILYLVALAASRTTWTPAMRFAGEQALCAAFIVAGFIKRNEREQFGQLLTGIGSCGMYLSFAGGHVFKGLYSSETVVALFVLLSLANLAYATWRSSRSFLTIGMVGGLVSAMLTMHQNNAPLDVGLHFVILVPCAVIVARNRFVDMAAWLWAASTLALLPVYADAEHAWTLRVGALYADALVCAAVYGFVHRNWPFDRACILPFAIVALAGIGGVAIDGVHNGSLHVLVLAAGAAGLGYALRSQLLASRSLYAAALAVAVALAPMGYTRTEAAIAFSVISIGLSISALRWAGNLLRVLGAVEIALAALAYLGVWLQNPPPLPRGNEFAVIIAMIAAVTVGAVCAVRGGLPMEGAIGVGSALLLPLFERFGNLCLSDSSWHIAPLVSAFYTTLAAFAMLLGLAHWRRYVTPVVFCWLLLLGMGGIYLQFASDAGRGYSLGVDLSMALSGLVAAILLADITARRTKGPDQDVLVFAAATAASIAVARVAYLPLVSYAQFSDGAAFGVGAAIAAVASAALYRATRIRALLAESWLGTAVMVSAVWSLGASGDLFPATLHKHEAMMSLMAAACVALVGFVTTQASAPSRRTAVVTATGVVAAISWMRFVFLELAIRLHVANSSAFAAAALTVFATAVALCYWRRLLAFVYLAWLGGATYLIAVIPPTWMLDVNHGGLRYVTPALVGALAVPLLLVHITSRLTSDRVLLTALPIVLDWMTFTRLCVHVTHLPFAGADAVVSLAWTAYAGLLMALGFHYRARFIRYWALAVFATVLAKVFIVDLANIEAVIRVAVLLFLGVCMVGAGYGYVRWRQMKPPGASAA